MKEYNQRHTAVLEAENDILRGAIQHNEEVIARLERCLSVAIALCIFNVIVFVTIIAAVLYAS